MGTSRIAALPIDHLIAETAAFPLASEAALKLAVTELDPELSEPTASLWRAAERHILGGFPAFSVDEAVAIRDRLWFDDGGGGRVPLYRYLRNVAEQFLEIQGANAKPAVPQQDRGIDGAPRAVSERLAWRWMSFALPPDLLLGALAKGGRHPENIDLLSPVLDRRLKDAGYAETHLHIGAAMEFSVLWAGAVWAIAEPGFMETDFQSPGAGLDEGKLLAPWLVRAAIARYVLAAYLNWGFGRHRDFDQFMRHTVIPEVLAVLGPGLLASLLLSLSALKEGKIAASGPAFSWLKEVYRRLLGGFMAGGFPTKLESAQEGDPISIFFPGEKNPEMRWVAEGLGYLERAPKDRNFAILFWQAIRVRALFYRHVVQRPMTPGLQWFIRFFGRIKPARPHGTRLLMESAACIDGIGKGLKSLEFRTAPDPARSKLLQYLRDIERVTRDCLPMLPVVTSNPKDSEDFEIGLVLHFTKDRGGEAQKGRPKANWLKSHADPRGNPTGYRYARFYNQKRNEAQALAWMLWHFPISLGLIRGIDVCTDELGTPTWVLAPLFRYVREVSSVVSEVLHQRCGVDVRPLRITAHTGEDFVHLLTGLRNVDEAIRLFDLREGDRIGHGVALGFDPHDWSQRAGRIPMACEDRLLDLAWEWSRYAHESIEPPPGRAPTLEREIARLSQMIFGESLLPFEIELFVERLYDERWVGWLGFPNTWRPTNLELDDKHPLRRLQRYLMDVSVFMNGRKTEWVDPSGEGEVLALLQSGLRKKLGQRGIAVEVNPSSNLLIGDLGDLTKHPLWRLYPPPGSKVDAPPVSICIGSDDPLTFATNLRQEYQFVHDALVLADCSEAEASQWLDEVRKTGLSYRFTVRNAFAPARITSLYNPERSLVRPPP
ncbi:MAG: hypothetical protein L0387_42770 [Acidobacteria bacterium]|nr:hypothetical protein [Acidobacteriota bacterium]